MTEQPERFAEAIAKTQREPLAAEVAGAEAERADLLQRFPREGWETVALADYAIGQEDSANTLCRLLEFQTPHMGSIRGGSARKLIIYKHKNKPGWYYPAPDYSDENDAWENVRAAFIRAFDLADEGRWEEIEGVEELQPGPALLLKLLYLYFPEQIVPICSQDHLRHFLRILGRPEAEDQSLGAVQLNRSLLGALRQREELADWDTKELERLLYDNFDPSPPRMFKIAPGHDAKYWDDCLSGGYICVGWDDVGDLRDYESKDSYLERFRKVHPLGSPSKSTEKANEVWRLIELRPGDLIVANKGTSQILGVGTVVEPGYVWEPGRSEYKHTVKVEWDETYAKPIKQQKRWALVTVAKVPQALQAEILGEKASSVGPKPAAPPEEIFRDIERSLVRKGQAVLYGPPGTGKTYFANQFAEWWLAKKNGESPTAQNAIGARVWWVVANPSADWKWSELFETGEVDFSRGRVLRNYDLVRPGDLVVGYEARPTKRIVALAKVDRLTTSSGGRSFALKPVSPVANGLTWEEVNEDELLANSEPIANKCRGTLFALSGDEAEYLIAALVERDPELTAKLGDFVGVSAPEPLTRLTFHPSYSYEDFVEGFRPVKRSGSGVQLALQPGVFTDLCRQAEADLETTYLLLIDEINRANVAKVFGELITLIELDKRGLAVRLPQSNERFVVPPNLYVLGTMNTADRSIKLLDVALRRRFAFIELMPDLSMLEGATVGGLSLYEFLNQLNEKVARSVGREKQIGHAYFLKNGEAISDPSEFALVFKQDVVPLLQEYAYDDYGRLADYIGDTLVDREAQVLNQEALSDPDALLQALEQQFSTGGTTE